MKRKSQGRMVTLLVLSLAGCGGLESPDLAHGAVAGRVVGASQTGYAYLLGHPEQRVTVAADGSLELTGVAAGAVHLIVYDDLQPDGMRRASVLTLQVPGAGRARFEVNGEAAPVDPSAKMDFAGLVVATAVPAAGGLASSSRFQVDGTDLAATTPPGATAVKLGLLPVAAGLYHLTATADGYQPATRTIDVGPATNAYDVMVQVEAGGTGPKGCAASPAGQQCLNGLVCDPATGLCGQCLVDGDCAAGTACDTSTHFCTAPPFGAADFGSGAICEVCTRDDQCLGAMTAPRRCELPPGAASGYCTVAPIYASYCPAGFALAADSEGIDRCIAVTGCADYFGAFGRACFTDEGCNDGGAVAGAICYGADPVGGLPGTCTAFCRANHQLPTVACPIPGYACDPSLNICLRP